MRWSGLAATLLFLALPAHAQSDIQPINCGNCVAWNVPHKPFKVYGNAYYVGTNELSSMLVTGPQGHVLLDGALPQSAAQIAANIEALGFKLADVKLIVNSHAHWDHAGGIAALARMTGATVVASAHGAAALEQGVSPGDDPQFDEKSLTHFPKVAKVRVVADGEVVKIGPLALTAHMTPGHTPGSTTWSWQSCEGARCLDVVYADSLNAASSGDFHFTGDAHHPDISASFRAAVATVGALKCDIIVSVHPGFTDTMEKYAATTPAHNAFITPGACGDYAKDANERLEERLKREREPSAAH
jgi:metallo-beta-lactamase class B